jgi:class 3 adenylate cyclase
MTFEFVWELNATPAQLWPYVSNTDRLNQAMGLPAVRYTAQLDEQHGVRRFAEAAVAGQRLHWEEYPYEWIEGRRMSVFREFSRGPLRWFVNVVEMQPRAGGGATLTQTFKVLPANFLGRLLARLEIGVKARKALTRVYEQMDRYLARGGHREPSADAFRKPASLPAARRSRLQQRLDRLRERDVDPQVAETLGQFLTHASDQEVARIRPLAFAERFRLDRNAVATACLSGAREGLLVLLWDILCPSCRIPADVQETLTALENHGHCQACNADFELDFANSVEMIFRAHPEIRAVETRTYCIGGPAFSAHVVAQTRLQPGERFAMDLALEEGTYRVRGPQLPFVADIRVTPQGAASRWELPLSRPPRREAIPLFRPDGQLITLTNDTPRELLARLERTASRKDALTAADAATIPLFRELFPAQVLSPGQMVSVTSISLLLLQLHDAANLYRRQGDGPAFEVVRQVLASAEAIVSRWGGAVVKTEGDGAFAVFTDTGAAVRAGLELMSKSPGEQKHSLRMAVHQGPAMVTTLNDRLDYFGNSVHVVRELLSMADAGEMLMTDGVAALPDVARLLRESRCERSVVTGSNGFAEGIIHRCRLVAGR